MQTIQLALRRFGGWVTALRSKFTGDIFFRTTIYVVALQMLLVVISVLAFSWALHFTNEQVIKTIVLHMTALINDYPHYQADSLPNSIQAIQNETVGYVFAGVVALAAIFGVLLAYVTLRPARDSLHYQKLFISNIAHELRTPLSTIKTSTEVLLLDPKLPDDVRATMLGNVDELDRISEIINNLLSLNRLIRPERMEFQSVDLGPIVDTVAERLSSLARERGIELTLRKNDYRTVLGNAVALEQIATNLIKNAISYTPKEADGVVTVSIEPDYKGSVVLSVADTGIGISKKDLFHIFEPFYRADLSRTRNVKKSGSGLGLAIVNEIARLHHGKIQIKSSLGLGTTVSIILPAGPSATQNGQATTLPQEQSGINEVSIDFSKNS